MIYNSHNQSLIEAFGSQQSDNRKTENEESSSNSCIA